MPNQETPTPVDLPKQEGAKEGPKMTRVQARASIGTDLKFVNNDMDDQRMILLAQALHSIVITKGKPIDENGISMIMESFRAVLESGNKPLISALVGVQRSVLGMFFDIKKGDASK